MTLTSKNKLSRHHNHPRNFCSIKNPLGRLADGNPRPKPPFFLYLQIQRLLHLPTFFDNPPSASFHPQRDVLALEDFAEDLTTLVICRASTELADGTIQIWRSADWFQHMANGGRAFRGCRHGSISTFALPTSSISDGSRLRSTLPILLTSPLPEATTVNIDCSRDTSTTASGSSGSGDLQPSSFSRKVKQPQPTTATPPTHSSARHPSLPQQLVIAVDCKKVFLLQPSHGCHPL